MQCPQCSSENTQRLRVAYEGGTNAIETTSRAAGVAVGAGFMSGGAVTRTSGVSQTQLAANAAPPEKKPYLVPLGFSVWFVGTAVLFPSVVLIYPLIAVPFYLIWRRFQYNRDVWPGLFAAWDASWMCHRCGHIYELHR